MLKIVFIKKEFIIIGFLVKKRGNKIIFQLSYCDFEEK